jgi:hypothetical protein
MEYKTLEQKIRLVMEQQANAGVLEYGSDIARDTYAKDTPGQTPGIDHSPEQHRHKPNLALDGVPEVGGTLKKPNFEKDAGMGKVAEAKGECGEGEYWCNKDQKCKPIPDGMKVDKDGMLVKEESIDEAGRWDNTSQGRAYRRLSPEEKARKAKANEVMRRAKGMKGKSKAAKQSIGKLKSVYKGSTRLQRNDVMSDLIADLEMAYLGEAMSDSERKQAAAKIFRMHQAKQAAKQANAALGNKSDPAAKAARRDAAGYKTSDDSHLDSKPSKPEPKRGRGQSDLPHIVSQLRAVVDTKDGKPSAVKFKDGTTKSVNPDHAKKWLKKHDSAKPADKLSMYKSHDSHKSFQSHVGEDVETVNELSGKTLSNYIQKAANPVKKNSAVNLASRGGYKLGSSEPHDLDAGEKEDRKAYNRGQGMQRAAIKLQKKMYGKKTNESNDSMQRMADTWNDHSDHPHPKVQKHIKKAEKAYNDKDHEGFYHHTQKAADHAYTLKYKPGVAKQGVTQFDRNRKPKNEEKMAGQEYRTQMSKVKSKDPAIRKAISNIYDKKSVKDIDHPEVKAAKKYMKTEANLQELSPELIKKVAHKRNVNVSMAGSEADYDRRDPDYQKAAQKQARNQKLRFSAGAKAANKIGKALSKSINK